MKLLKRNISAIFFNFWLVGNTFGEFCWSNMFLIFVTQKVL